MKVSDNMARDGRNSTYLRIVDASLELFNQYGERNISTNHIATHLNISPGNLYYHFANKDEIIVQLFKRYSKEQLAYLSETKLPNNMMHCIDYMKGIYDIMWDYRFLFSDVNTLLSRSAELLGEHNEFTHERIAPLLVKLLSNLKELGWIEIDEVGKQDLAINMWVMTKYWFDFDRSLSKGEINEHSKSRGVYQTLSQLRPYLKEQYIQEFDDMMKQLKG